MGSNSSPFNHWLFNDRIGLHFLSIWIFNYMIRLRPLSIRLYIRCVRLEAALCRMISVWHQSIMRAIWKLKDPSALLSFSQYFCHSSSNAPNDGNRLRPLSIWLHNNGNRLHLSSVWLLNDRIRLHPLSIRIFNYMIRLCPLSIWLFNDRLRLQPSQPLTL